jgi:hypothetical protein
MIVTTFFVLLLVIGPHSKVTRRSGTCNAANLFAEAISYSVLGNWTDVSLMTYYASLKNQFLLVFGNHTWQNLDCGNASTTSLGEYDRESKLPIHIYNNELSCRTLRQKGVDHIYFYGDSYMRQVYAAVLITLNGNYVNGSISSSQYSMNNGAKSCQYHQQFNEKNCGIRQLDEDAIVCDGNVNLHHMHHGGYNIQTCRSRQKKNKNSRAINIFSTGNHKVLDGHGGRYGVNNASAHIERFEVDFCRQLRSEQEATNKDKKKELETSHGCTNWWLSTHHRIIGWFPDEKGPITRTFNEEMRSFFDSGACGAYNTIDVYNMTQSLVETFTLDATCEANKQKSMSVSYDYVHFGMEINLVKAQIVLDAWASGLENVETKNNHGKLRR